MSDFFGLRIAMSALYAQRQALDVTGHNIANANTEGYSRQRVKLAADGGQVLPAMFSKAPSTGSGVTVQGTDRLRDVFLEARGLQEHAADQDLRANQKLLSRIELTFAEPGENGVQGQLAEFWSGWDDVVVNPGDAAPRTQLLERAQTVAVGLNQISRDLSSLRNDARSQIDNRIAEINNSAARIADLNQSIANATNAGYSPNDLMDQRDVLVAKLGQMVGITTSPGDAGKLDVFIGGTAIVRGETSNALAASTDTANPLGQNWYPVKVTWAKDGYGAAVNGGELGGLVHGVNSVLPRYRNQVDAIAVTLRDEVNAVHATGSGLDGVTGRSFFTGTTAGDFAVNPAMVADPRRIAAGGPPPAGTLDTASAQKLADLAGGKTDQAYRSLIVGLGVESQAAQRRVEIQADITRQVDAARESEAGVNLDEEMANMVAFQHAYNAAARFLTTIDSVLDTLINRTGLVGR